MLDKATQYFEKFKKKIIEIYEKTLHSFITTLFNSQVSILFLGIDNAGKTTLLNLLKNESATATMPTSHPTNTDIEIGNMNANIYDLGGHGPARIAWKDYFHQCDGCVFIFDAEDSLRFSEVREAYKLVRDLLNEKSSVIPVCVLVNKMDKVYRMFGGDENSVDEYIRECLEKCGIEENVNLKISRVSMIKDDNKKHDKGIYNSFIWLDKAIKERKSNRNSL
ncbi:small GTP-binding protein domain [Edhazardia aedis USNM 41457]|uniref:Small COPII coat GTPase SAR1 n=1 Tax=Edhazardia aedis (strain USNM 41457) TaxID=1003232 RepID=J9DAW7_EDHAE|nr:small GTP-binding protein domain [Edhazardia aedis USNM 41457]|eukprot:EJW04916.1 small GTP-binding protein domain [Edhazardia aedis USNM 41457]